jgi:HK97 family phage major capsid protein
MRTLQEINARMEAIRHELAGIAELPEPEGDDAARAQTIQDRSDLTDELLAEHDELKAERQPLADRQERLDAVRATATSGANSERGSFQAPNVIIQRDAFSNLDHVRDGLVPPDQLRSRALEAIEKAPSWMSDAGRERATQLVENPDGTDRQAPLIARHMLMTGSPQYYQEFVEYARSQGVLVGPQMRAAMSTTGANGGFLVPFTLDPTIILTNAGVADPIRSIATIKTIATTTWEGVTSAGVTAEWTGESSSAEWADATPTFGQPSITPKKADAWVQGSYEILADSGFASELGRLLADAKARLEAAAFATGNTGATQPRGIVAAVNAVTASIVTSLTVSAFAKGDVYNVSGALRPRDSAAASWIANKNVYNLIRQFDTAGGSSFWANLGMKTPSELLDAPVYECSSMTSAITTGAAILLAGNFAEYYVVDRVGMSVLYEPMVRGVSSGRPTGQAGWAAFWRVGADCVDPAAFKVLHLETTATAVALA